MKNRFTTTIPVIVTCAIFFAAACNTNSKLNQISYMILSNEQRDMVNLSKDNNQDIAYFLYQTAEKYNSLEIWADTYEKGELLESNKLGAFVDILDKSGKKEGSKGTIAVVTNALPDIKWGFGVQEDGEQVVSRSVAYETSVKRGGVGSSWPLNQPVNIEAGKDIVLYVSVFNFGGNMTSVDMDTQQFIDNPELLKDFDYVRIIKCKFSRSILPYGTFIQH